jgi:hypothetical protein
VGKVSPKPDAGGDTPTLVAALAGASLSQESIFRSELGRGILWGSKKPERAGESSAARNGACGPEFGTARANLDFSASGPYDLLGGWP